MADEDNGLDLGDAFKESVRSLRKKLTRKRPGRRPRVRPVPPLVLPATVCDYCCTLDPLLRSLVGACRDCKCPQ